MNAVLVIVQGGSFVARPSTIGASEDEMAAQAAGNLPEWRREAIAKNMLEAANVLRLSFSEGHC
jgi:hypothetical protein